MWGIVHDHREASGVLSLPDFLRIDTSQHKMGYLYSLRKVGLSESSALS